MARKTVMGFGRGGSTSKQSLPSKPCCCQTAQILLQNGQSVGHGWDQSEAPKNSSHHLRHIYMTTSVYNLATFPFLMLGGGGFQPSLPLLTTTPLLVATLLPCLPVPSIHTPIIGAQVTQDPSSMAVCGQHLPRAVHCTFCMS